MRSSCLYVCDSACGSVCLFARISQKPRVQTSRNFLATMQYIMYLCTFCFVDDVMFSHYGPNTDTGLESATYLCTTTNQVAQLHCAPGGEACIVSHILAETVSTSETSVKNTSRSVVIKNCLKASTITLFSFLLRNAFYSQRYSVCYFNFMLDL